MTGVKPTHPHPSPPEYPPVYVERLVLQLVVLEDVQPPPLVGLAGLGRGHMLQHGAAGYLHRVGSDTTDA